MRNLVEGSPVLFREPRAPSFGLGGKRGIEADRLWHPSLTNYCVLWFALLWAPFSFHLLICLRYQHIYPLVIFNLTRR